MDVLAVVLLIMASAYHSLTTNIARFSVMSRSVIIPGKNHAPKNRQVRNPRADGRWRFRHRLPWERYRAISRAVENTARRAMAKRLEDMKEKESELVPYYSFGTM